MTITKRGQTMGTDHRVTVGETKRSDGTAWTGEEAITTCNLQDTQTHTRMAKFRTPKVQDTQERETGELLELKLARQEARINDRTRESIQVELIGRSEKNLKLKFEFFWRVERPLSLSLRASKQWSQAIGARCRLTLTVRLTVCLKPGMRSSRNGNREKQKKPTKRSTDCGTLCGA